MNLAFTESQEALRSLARQVLTGEVTTDRLKEAERSPDWYDRGLWFELARAGIAGAGIPEEHGGSGGGIIEICLVLYEVGRTVAPVPAWPSMVAAHTVARFGSEEQKARLLPPAATGELILSASQENSDVISVSEGRLSGRASFVPAAGVASRIVVPVGETLWLVDHASATLERQTVTNGAPRFDVVLDGVIGEEIPGSSSSWLERHLIVGLCATQLGIAEAALRMTASYLSEREQFSRKIGSFQAVQQRAADAYIDVEAMRWTTWQAAWRLAEGRPADEEVAVAASWAADGGQRVLAAAQHLHGGIGLDLEYPLHRYTLTGKLVEVSLGGGARQLAQLGALMAR